MSVVIELSREESFSSFDSDINDNVVARFGNGDITDVRWKIEKNYIIWFLAGEASNQLKIFSIVDSAGATRLWSCSKVRC